MLREKKNFITRNQSGQSLVEFAMSLLLIFGVLLFFIQLSLVLGWANYTQYATFMAARAYLSAGANPGDQEDRARSVLSHMVKMGDGSSQDRFPMIAKGYGGGNPMGAQIGPSQNFDRTNYNLSWMQGVRYTFRSRIFLLPLGKQGQTTQGLPDTDLSLTSESWLGRDPTYSECMTYMNSTFGGTVSGKQVLIDNGC